MRSTLPDTMPDGSEDKAASKGVEEEKFSVEDLLDNPRRIGASGRAIAGAFEGVDPARRIYTAEDATKRVDQFLTRKESSD